MTGEIRSHRVFSQRPFGPMLNVDPMFVPKGSSEVFFQVNIMTDQRNADFQSKGLQRLPVPWKGPRPVC